MATSCYSVVGEKKSKVAVKVRSDEPTVLINADTVDAVVKAAMCKAAPSKVGAGGGKAASKVRGNALSRVDSSAPTAMIAPEGR